MNDNTVFAIQPLELVHRGTDATDGTTVQRKNLRKNGKTNLFAWLVRTVIQFPETQSQHKKQCVVCCS